MIFTRRTAAVLLAVLFLAGCFDLTPRPLNETGFLPPVINYTQEEKRIASGSPNPGGIDAGSGPMVCELEDLLENQSISIMVSGRNVRSAFTDPATNQTYTTVIKGDEYYIKAVGTYAMGNCTWLYFSKDTFGGYSPPTGSQTAIMGNLSLGQPSLPTCKAGSFGNEVFDTNGTVCDFRQFLNVSAANAAN